MATQAQIAKFVGNATGKLGFLKWAQIALPPAASAAVLQAAAKAAKPTSGLGALRALGARSTRGMGMLGAGSGMYGRRGVGAFGQTGSTGMTTAEMAGDYSSTTGAPVTTPAPEAVADNSSASSSWITSIGTALSAALPAAASAYGSYTVANAQANAISSAAQANLIRAQQGLSPLPYLGTGTALGGSSLLPILLIGGAVLLVASMEEKK